MLKTANVDLQGSVRVDINHIDEVIAPFGLSRPHLHKDVAVGRQLAAQLIDSEIASVESFEAMSAHSGVGMLIHRECGEITGVAGFLMLSKSGRRAMLENEFNGRNPDIAHVSRVGEPVYATYAWLGAATTHAGRTAVVMVSASLKRYIFGDLPAFARAATPAGAAALEKYLGLVQLAGTDDVYWDPGFASPSVKTHVAAEDIQAVRKRASR